MDDAMLKRSFGHYTRVIVDVDLEGQLRVLQDKKCKCMRIFLLLKPFKNCHSLDYRVEPSSCFYEKVRQVKLKHGSNHLAKIGVKDGSSYIAASSTAKHI
ncbi:hypothetical protein JHK85_000839 [Glycine max]|nr:hypothetical protein JHK85_000839 [Glycine max]